MGNLGKGTRRHFNPLPFLEDNNSTESLQYYDRGYVRFAYDEKSCTNGSITFLNVDNSTLYNEGNSCNIIAIPVIERTYGE